MSAVSTSALAQSQDATRSLANGDSLLIDGRTFSITPGKAKGDVSAEIAKLDAHEVGPGAIVFRSGDRLYIVDSAPPAQNATLMYDPAIERQRALGLRAELDYERQRPLGLRDRQLDYERERPLGLRDSQLDYERQRPLGLRDSQLDYERQRPLGLRDSQLDYERQRPLGLRDSQLDYERQRPLGLRDSSLDYERQRPLGLRDSQLD